MDSPLESIALHLRNCGFEAELKSSIFGAKRVHVTLNDYFIEVKRDNSWYYIEYKGFHYKVYASAKVRILNHSNRDIIQLIALVKSFSNYRAD